MEDFINTNTITDSQEEIHNKYFIKYQGTWKEFKKDVNEFLEKTYFNLINLNQLSSIGDIFNFLLKRLEEKFEYDSALIILFNHELNPLDGKSSDIQIINYDNQKKQIEGDSIIVTVPIIPLFWNDYLHDPQGIINVKCIINSKKLSILPEPFVLNKIKQYFSTSQNFETEIFPTSDEWNNLRILDFYFLLEQSLMLFLYYENFNLIDFRFTNTNGGDSAQYRMNHLLYKSSFLPYIKENKDIFLPIKVYFDGVVCFQGNLIVGDILFTKPIDWDKQWGAPWVWKNEDEI